MKPSHYFFLFLLTHTCISFSVKAQVTDRKSAVVYQDYADSVMEINPKKALEYYEKAAGYYREINDFDNYSNLLIQTARTYAILDEYHKAFDTLINAEAIILKELSETHLNLGILNRTKGIFYNEINQLDSALFYFDKSLSILVGNPKASQRQIGGTHANMGATYHRMNSLENALVKYKEAVEMILKADSQDASVLGIYGNMALVYSRLADFELAEEYAKKNLDLRIKKFGNNHLSTAYGYYGVGRTYYYKRDFSTSKDYYLKTLAIREAILPAHNRSVLRIYSNLSENYSELGEYDSAMFYGYKVLNALNKYHPDDKVSLRINYLVLSKLHFQKALKTEDLSFIKTSNEYLDTLNIITEDHDLRTQGLYYFLRARNEWKENDYSTALALCQKGLSILTPTLSSTDTNENPTSKDIIFEKDHVLEILRLKTDCLIDSAKTIPQNQEILQLLHSTILSVDGLIDDLFFNSYSPNTNLSFINKYNHYFEYCISFINEKENVGFKEGSFQIVEKIRARVLKKTSLLNQKRIGDSLQVEKEKELSNSMESIKSTLLQTENTTKNESVIRMLNDSLFQIKYQHIEVKKKIKEDYENENDYLLSNKIITINEVQDNVLKKNQSLVEYFVGDSAIYAFVINKNDFKIEVLPYSDSLVKAINLLPIYLENEDIVNYSRVAYQLYQQLIEPLNLETENLIIIPDGLLWQLNFDILLSSQSERNDFREFDYLIKKHNISYAYSATLLLQDLNSIRYSKPKFECLAFSYNDPNDTTMGKRCQP